MCRSIDNYDKFLIVAQARMPVLQVIIVTIIFYGTEHWYFIALVLIVQIIVVGASRSLPSNRERGAPNPLTGQN